MSDLKVLHKGGRSDQARAFQGALNRRLDARDLDDYKINVDGVVGEKTLVAARKGAWILGAQKATFESITKKGQIPIGVQHMVLNPGRRTAEQLDFARKRLSQFEADRKNREHATGPRGRIVKNAFQAAHNYRENPGAYHYLAGGIANLIFLSPSPRNYRSDCSQFVAAVYKAAGLPSPANVAHEYASTYTMIRRGKVTSSPSAGDIGMYGPRDAPHHVEIYCHAPGAEFIGHGSPPIDSLTPGRPDFYLTYDFLNDLSSEFKPETFQTVADMNLTGELARSEEAAKGGIVVRNAPPEFEGALVSGFSGHVPDDAAVDDDSLPATSEADSEV